MGTTAQRFNPIAYPPLGEACLKVLRRVGAIQRERLTRALMESLFRGIDFAGKRVLDIGGGDGVYSFYAAAMGAREVICLEPEAAGSIGGELSMFERLRAEMPDLPVKLVQRTVADFRDDEGFDVVAMIASINHLDEEACTRLPHDAGARRAYHQAFSHIAALTRPGGRLVIADATRYNFFAMLGVKNPLCPTIEWHKHQPPAVWAQLLREAGFAHPRVSWEPLYSLGSTVQGLLSNPVAAWFLKSCFRLQVEKPAPR